MALSRIRVWTIVLMPVLAAAVLSGSASSVVANTCTMTGEIAGTIRLQDFTGDASLAPIRVELMQGDDVLATQTVTAGTYAFGCVAPGSYSVRFTACGWVRQIVAPLAVVAGATAQADVSMPNGDLNGDGSIDLNDFSIADKNYGLRADADVGLLNGSFELGIDPGLQRSMWAVDAQTITGWTLASGTCDYARTAWNAHDGVRSVDLNGDSPGRLTQAFAVRAGVHYRLLFHMAGNNTDPAAYVHPVKTLTASISGSATASGDYSFDITGTSPTDMGWQAKTLDFTASQTGTAQLRFTSTFSPTGSGSSGHPYVWYGPVIDDIRVWTVGQTGAIGIDTVLQTGLFAKRSNAIRQLTDVTFHNAGGLVAASLVITSPDGVTTYTTEPLGTLDHGSMTERLAFPDPEQPIAVRLCVVDPVGTILAVKSYTIQPLPHWEVYVAPGSHSDWGWGFSTYEAMDVNLDIFEKALAALDADPDYRYTVESAATVKYYCEKHPGQATKIAQHLASGRLEVSALWVLPETGIWDGESYVRMVSLAKGYLGRQFGYDVATAQNHDVPGYPRQLGQILSKSGISGFIWSRGDGAPAPLYGEISPDGSRELSYRVPHSWLYTMGFALGVTEGVNEVKEKLLPYLNGLSSSLWPVKKVLVPLEHDWSYPYPTVTQVAREWNEQYAYPKLIVSTPRECFSSINSDEVTASNAAYIAEGWAVGDVAFAPLTGLQRKAESSLLTAEKLATLAYLFGGVAYPQGRIQEAWEKLALTEEHNFGNQHDPLNFKERYSLAGNANSVAQSIAGLSLGSLASLVNKTGSGTAIVVFNSLFAYRQDLVEVSVTLPSGGIVLRDAYGTAIPFEIEVVSGSSAILRFVAWVPGFGYTTYYLVPGTPNPPPAELTSTPTTIENSYYRVTVNATSGVLTSIYDKTLGLELLDSRAPCAGNELLVDRSFKYAGMVLDDDDLLAQQSGLDMTTEQRHPNDAYLMWRQKSNSAVVSTATSSLCARITVTGTMLNSTYSQQITLYPGIRRIYVNNKINWQGRNHAKVKLALPLAMSNPTLTIGEPFGARSITTTPVPSVQKWLEVNDGSWGIGVATSGQCGFVDSTLYPVLLWDEHTWTSGEGVYWFSPKPWAYDYSYVITSHPGNWLAGKTWDLGWQHANPLVAATAQPGPGSMPQQTSFVSQSAQTVVPTVFKVADDGAGVVLRYYEPSGLDVSAGFMLNSYMQSKLTEAWTSKITEEKQSQLSMSSGALSVPASHNTIGTLRFGGSSVNPVRLEPYEATPVGFTPYTEAEIHAGPYVSFTEYIQNAGFEMGGWCSGSYGPYPDSWSGILDGSNVWGTGAAGTVLVDDRSLSHSGNRCVKITLSDALRGSGTQFCQMLAVTSEMKGKVVRFSCYVRSTRPNTMLDLEAYSGGTLLAGDFVKLAPYGEWTYYYVDLIVPPQADSLALGLRVTDSGSGEAYFDDASLRVFSDYNGWEQSVRAK